MLLVRLACWDSARAAPKRMETDAWPAFAMPSPTIPIFCSVMTIYSISVSISNWFHRRTNVGGIWGVGSQSLSRVVDDDHTTTEVAGRATRSQIRSVSSTKEDSNKNKVVWCCRLLFLPTPKDDCHRLWQNIRTGDSGERIWTSGRLLPA